MVLSFTVFEWGEMGKKESGKRLAERVKDTCVETQLTRYYLMQIACLKA